MTKPAAATRSIVIEREMLHPPEKIWRALTQSALIEEWLMKNDFQPVPGHRFNFRAAPMPHWNGVVDCQVLSRRTQSTALLQLERFGRRSGARTQNGRHLDADADEARRSRADGAVGLPARRRSQLPGSKLWLAALSRGPGEGSGGAGLTMPVSRYHPLLVSLHWVLALLIVAALTVGFFWLGSIHNSDPQKITVLRVHMAGGMLILVLMGIRFFVRMRTSRPPAATTGFALLDRLAPIIHYGFYVLVLLMVATGYTTAILAGLPAIVFGGSGDPLPPTLMIYPSFAAHGFIANLLVGFIALHVLAAFYHQFVRKDGLFRRMLFGRRALNLSLRTE